MIPADDSGRALFEDFREAQAINGRAIRAILALAGWRVMSTPFVEEFSFYLMPGAGGPADLLVGPLTFWSITHDFKLPMVSMFSRGMRELERDRRKHR